MIKVTKFGEDLSNGFWTLEEKPGNGSFPSVPSPPPPHVNLRLRYQVIKIGRLPLKSVSEVNLQAD